MLPAVQERFSLDDRSEHRVHGKLYAYLRVRRKDALDASTAEPLEVVVMIRTPDLARKVAVRRLTPAWSRSTDHQVGPGRHLPLERRARSRRRLPTRRHARFPDAALPGRWVVAGRDTEGLVGARSDGDAPGGALRRYTHHLHASADHRRDVYAQPDVEDAGTRCASAECQEHGSHEGEGDAPAPRAAGRCVVHMRR